MLRISVFTTLLLLLPIAAAGGDTEPSAPYNRQAAKSKFVRPAAVPYPKDNAFTPERHDLGRMLFFDPRLSGSGILSCGSCHNPSFSWGDGMARAVGHGMQTLGRRTPTLLNLAWSEAFFWDGRADSLEAQALGPIAAAGEMNMPLPLLVEKVRGIAGYREFFDRAYPGSPIDEKVIAKAIATFERGIVSGTAPFDRWIAGQEDAIPAEAKHGFDLFNTKARCAKCHSGWNFSDDGFYDIGLRGSDRGRGALLPKMEAVQFAFKTPTLRNVVHRAPYMHDGSCKSLEDAVTAYDEGGLVPHRPSLSPDIVPLHLTAAERRALVRFLETLTSADPPVAFPVLPR